MQFVVNTTESGKMLKQILQNRFHFSRRMFRRLREEQRVSVNQKIVYYTSRLIEGDVVEVRLEETNEDCFIPPQKVDFTVVFEDDDILLVDKPAGLVVHPTMGYQDGTLANGIAYHAKERGEFYLFRPVTRLDKDTSGIMVIAKHAHAHAMLSKQMKKKRYQRTYVAICHGHIAPSRGTIDLPIGLSTSSIIERVIDQENGKEAITHYETLRRLKDATMVKLSLETGRTHQIRVHLASIGHPIIGDTLYGAKDKHQWILRQALHAKEIEIFHPSRYEWFKWSIPMAEDMQRLAEKLTVRP
ncbi:RluA family pseudouridine synthase [Shimazuella sp. AN120528]|uniref:RluA family pseudouridine synthase n=1 Tax=Shimazuella soli TaxID=1892854 RepID=UPI001F1168B2|nr:RluA family pseudouridine synthase [Shimazuella soli]MCH5584628.1 RluA family pseudouridine synthase [Shimazuella soli]